jgi:hypothetical protein
MKSYRIRHAEIGASLRKGESYASAFRNEVGGGDAEKSLDGVLERLRGVTNRWPDIVAVEPLELDPSL